MKAYLGIGTNIGDRLKNIENAVKALSCLPHTQPLKISAVYETEPWGYTQQPNFYNICVEIDTRLSPKALLGACLGIEAAAGRERPFKNAPRIIDIDVLLYENVTMKEPELNIPHPLIGERAFVLVPLKDVLPELEFFGADYAENYKKAEKSGVKRVCELKI